MAVTAKVTAPVPEPPEVVSGNVDPNVPDVDVTIKDCWARWLTLKDCETCNAGR